MTLFEQIQLGSLRLKKQNGHVGHDQESCQYQWRRGRSDGSVLYTKEQSAGLIFTEAINISEKATGSLYTPGIYTKEQNGSLGERSRQPFVRMAGSLLPSFGTQGV